MTHRIELTARFPDGTPYTFGVDVTTDAPRPFHAPDKLAAFACARIAGAIGHAYQAYEVHRRVPGGVGERGNG